MLGGAVSQTSLTPLKGVCFATGGEDLSVKGVSEMLERKERKERSERKEKRKDQEDQQTDNKSEILLCIRVTKLRFVTRLWGTSDTTVSGVSSDVTQRHFYEMFGKGFVTVLLKICERYLTYQ